MSCVIGRSNENVGWQNMNKALGVNPDCFGEVELLPVKYLTHFCHATENIRKPEDY